MIMKIIILAMMAVIVISLLSALVFLVKDSEHSKRTVKALTFRIALSLSLFIFLLLAFKCGLIQPHAL
jgi:hypothetical protein